MDAEYEKLAYVLTQVFKMKLLYYRKLAQP